MSQRHSPLTSITTANAKDLQLKWVFQARWLDYYQATPLVVDGIMYTTQGNDVLALDAATGKIFWISPYTPSSDARFCCGRITRGLAIFNDTLFLATVDAHLIAIDARTGVPQWNRIVADATAGYSMTLAPLVIKDKVIVGTAGGEFGIRGFIAAYEAATGKEAWRFNTVPLPGEPGHETWGEGWKTGGASIWVTGSYDPETNLTFWGVGNPGPDYNATTRPGDNLYSNSVVALDADTGKLKWHYQFSPADEFDWDAVQVPVLADITWQGKPRKVMLWANRNGFFYVLDRGTGEFLQATAIAKQNWNAGFDPKGRPIRTPNSAPSYEGVLIYPGNQGATNWFNPSFSPRTGLFYVNVWENTHHIFARTDAPYKEGASYTQGRLTTNYPGRGIAAGMRAQQRPNLRMEEENFGTVRAFDPQTGKWKWEYKMSDLTDAGILTTASDVLFTGGREGYFFALDARNGSLLWKIQLGGPIQNGPMSYSVAGRQYVAVSASNSLFVFGLP
jgi:alcohol dehydrogenase (cytochrome c)